MSKKTCPACGGSGRVPDYAKAPIRESNVRVSYQQKTCSMCGGTGAITSGGGTGCGFLLALGALPLGGILFGVFA